MLMEDGITRPFDGTFASWTYEPPDDTAHAAAEIRRRFGWA
jgi:mitochondrial fission protein ELM1